MVYKDAADCPGRFQWDETSGSFFASQSNNCGPTSVTKIADFYKDTRFSIENTRRSSVGCCVPTTCSQQALMLSRRNVPAKAMWIDNKFQLDDLIGWSGRRPIVIGIQMSRVPTYIKDHPFDGWHAVTVMKRVERNGVKGYLVNDPNFSPPGGYRPDPDHGKKFYPEWAMDYAYLQNYIRWSVVPLNAKYIPSTDHYAEGDPAEMGKLFVNEIGHEVTIKAFKPIRDGYTTKDKVLKRTGSRATHRVIGKIPKHSVSDYEQQFGAVWLIETFAGNGMTRIGYVKSIDLVDGSYK